MTALPDYLSRIQQLVSEHEATPFEWGVNDCAIWGGKAIEAVTGNAVHSDFVGRYQTKVGGFRVFKKTTGFASHIDWLVANYSEMNPAFVGVGDLGIVETKDGPAVVLCIGEFAAGPGPDGLIRFPITELTRAFRVAGA